MPLIPWGRGHKDKPSGEACKICIIATRLLFNSFYSVYCILYMDSGFPCDSFVHSVCMRTHGCGCVIEGSASQVWVQGGYEAEYVSEAKYQAAVQHDPTINHGFLSLRSHVIRMKQEDPNCKFRLERVAPAIKEKVRASQSRQQGLEKPETHFVLLSVYTEEYGKPDPSQIVYEVIDGVSVPGVDVLTGRAGWHKRVNRDMCDVTKTAELTDINIDPTGQAADRMFQASKKQLTKAYVQPSRKALLHPPSASSACAQASSCCVSRDVGGSGGCSGSGDVSFLLVFWLLLATILLYDDYS